jgi:hypothetical protein
VSIEYEPPTEDDGPDPDRLRDEAWDRKHIRTPIVIVDGNPSGCDCTSRCEFPCWQRVGLTDEPCCRGCAPL